MAKSKALFEDELITKYKYGKEVYLALEHHRKSNRWSLRDKADEICLKLEDYKKESVEEALQVYLSITNRIVPHINYFVKIAERLNTETKTQTTTEPGPKVLWGKTI